MLTPGSRRRRRKRAAAADVGWWWHSIDLGDGVVVPGQKSADQLRSEVAGLQLPPLTGKTVLDVGSWDGFFAFEAERRGAAHVVALDHLAWCADLPALDAYAFRCYEEGRPLPPWEDVPELWQDGAPGKRGFDLARDLLGSRVESIVADFMTFDLDVLGAFDVVLFLGVLYDLRDPLRALERLRMLTREVAVIETQANFDASSENQAVWEFLEHRQLSQDPTNWWVPNLRALIGLCRAAGFRDVQVCQGPEVAPAGSGGGPCAYRAVVHARP